MSPALTIDPADGSIRVAGIALALSKGSLRDEAANAMSPLLRGENDFGNGYEWLSFHKVMLGRQPCGFALCFHHGRLLQVHFSVMIPGAEVQDGWPTREAIEEELAFIRSELRSQLGVDVGERGARFAWGSVWSRFDPKGFQASSGLRYDA